LRKIVAYPVDESLPNPYLVFRFYSMPNDSLHALESEIPDELNQLQVRRLHDRITGDSRSRL